MMAAVPATHKTVTAMPTIHISGFDGLVAVCVSISCPLGLRLLRRPKGAGASFFAGCYRLSVLPTSLPIRPPTAAPPSVPRVLPPVRTAPPTAPAPAPIAVSWSRFDIPPQPDRPSAATTTAPARTFIVFIFGSPCFAIRLLEAHVVLDGKDAAHASRNRYRFVHVGAGAHEAAQLDLALEGLDVDLGGLERGIIEDRCLDLRGDGAVVHVLARALLRGGRGATRHQR